MELRLGRRLQRRGAAPRALHGYLRSRPEEPVAGRLLRPPDGLPQEPLITSIESPPLACPDHGMPWQRAKERVACQHKPAVGLTKGTPKGLARPRNASAPKEARVQLRS